MTALQQAGPTPLIWPVVTGEWFKNLWSTPFFACNRWPASCYCGLINRWHRELAPGIRSGWLIRWKFQAQKLLSNEGKNGWHGNILGQQSSLTWLMELQQAGLILLAWPRDSESQICQRQLGIFVSDDQPLPASCSGGNRPEVCPIGIANGNRVLVLLGPALLCMPQPTSSAL